MARILVVDDAAYVRMKSAKLLASQGYDVEEAANGVEAVNKYSAVRPDLVLMDITMPVMDGLTALKEIRKADASAKVVMCSAIGQESMVIEAIGAGASDFIVKPYQPERILGALRKLLRKGE